MSGAVHGLQLLLVEPQFVMRRTLVAVARDLGVAQLQEATSIDAALALLAARRFDGLVLAVGDGPAAVQLLTRLRQGRFASEAGIPVVALGDGAPRSLDAQLAPLHVLATLYKPFKVAALLQLLQQMAPAHA